MKRFSLTFCDKRNYGAMLQCYAVQRLCTNEGLTIEYLSLPQPIHFKAFIKHLIPKYRKMDSRSSSFIRKNIRVRKIKGSLESFLGGQNEETLLLVGSDQVWNPLIEDNLFLCRFHLPAVRKRSYACSFGYFREDEKLAKIVEPIFDFENVSLREEDAWKYFSKIAKGKEVTCDLDPTLLLDPLIWSELASQSKSVIPNEYILVFGIYWDARFNQYLKDMHEKTGLPIISISESKDIYSNSYQYGCSPCDFLRLMERATYVVTSSFHGVCFSVAFERPFCALVNPSLPSRITSLLKRLDLEGRIYDFPTLDYENCFSSAGKKLSAWREESANRFKEIIR